MGEIRWEIRKEQQEDHEVIIERNAYQIFSTRRTGQSYPITLEIIELHLENGYEKDYQEQAA